jgi:hypothetical protein
MNHILYKDGILKAKPFKRLPWPCPLAKNESEFVGRLPTHKLG